MIMVHLLQLVLLLLLLLLLLLRFLVHQMGVMNILATSQMYFLYLPL
jgi:hypothetical protein